MANTILSSEVDRSQPSEAGSELSLEGNFVFWVTCNEYVGKLAPSQLLACGCGFAIVFVPERPGGGDGIPKATLTRKFLKNEGNGEKKNIRVIDVSPATLMGLCSLELQLVFES